MNLTGAIPARLPDLDDWKAQVKCQTGCPVATDAGRYVQLIAEGRDEEGLLIASLGDQLHVASGVGRDRTARLTFDLRLPVFEVGQARSNCARQDHPDRLRCMVGASGPASKRGASTLFSRCTCSSVSRSIASSSAISAA